MVVKTPDDPEKALSQVGGQVLPYYLPDLLQYVETDIAKARARLASLKKVKDQPVQLKAQLDEFTQLLPPYSELGSQLRRTISEKEKLQILELSTVNFSVETITSKRSGVVEFGSLLSALEPFREVVKKINFSNSTVVVGANAYQILKLADYPKLTDLNLSGIQPTTGFWTAVGQLKQVRRLWLSGATISDDDLNKLLVACSDRLELVDLSSLTVKKGSETLDGDVWVEQALVPAHDLRFACLKYLSLAGNKLTNQDLAALDRFVCLQGLNLADNPEITDVGLKKLEHIALLKDLSLSGTGHPKRGSAAVTDAGVAGLLTRNKATLNYLNLSGTTTLADPTSPAISAIHEMGLLESLNMAGTAINNHGLRKIWKFADKALAAVVGAEAEVFRPFPWLLALDVSDTAVTDAGFIDMDEIGFPRLQTIRSKTTDLNVTTGGINRRNALLPARYPGNFNLATLVKQ